MEKHEQPLPGERMGRDKERYICGVVGGFKAELHTAQKELEENEQGLERAVAIMRKVEIAGSFERDPAALDELIRLLGKQREALEETISMLQKGIERAQADLMGEEMPEEGKSSDPKKLH